MLYPMGYSKSPLLGLAKLSFAWFRFRKADATFDGVVIGWLIVIVELFIR